MRRNAERRLCLCALAGLLSAIALLAPVACQTVEQPVERVSVRPGINDEYRNADVHKWEDRFEGESREVYRQRARIVAALGLRSGQIVADIGAGTGLFTIPLAEAVSPRGRVFAVDITPQFVTHIRERATSAGLANVDTVVCKEDSVDLPAKSIDIAFVCDTYHHFEYPQSTLRSIHRALRPGGVLVIVDFERIEGVSREWILEHVRIGKAETIREISSAGFELIDDGRRYDFLDENYLIKFRRGK